MNGGFYDFQNRLEYYAARLLSGAENIDNDYKNIDKVFQIMICDFTLVESETEPLLINTMKNQYGHEFGSLINIVTLELPKIKLPKTDIEKISNVELESWYENLTSAEKWGIFFKWADDPKKNSHISKLFDKSRGTENARRILMQVSQKEKDWAMAESRRKFVMDYTSNYNAAIRKGRKEGYDKGHEEGYDKGREEGYDKGRAEQLAADQAEIAELKARIAQLESAIAN